MPGSISRGYPSTVVQCRSPQAPQLTTSHMGNRPDALLVVDGRHLRHALDRLVVATVEQQAQVLKELVGALEDNHRVTFVQRTLHDSTLTGKPSDLHRLLSEGSRDGQQQQQPPQHRKPTFLPRIKPMTPRTGRRIDPETLEPMSDKDVTIMVEEGVAMSMCLDVLSATVKPYKALVVITADGDLTQVLEQVSAAGVHVSVCGMRDSMAPSLLKFVKEPTSSGTKWLESLILNALERVVAKGDGAKVPYRGKCSRGRQCQMRDESHRAAYLHPCPDWSMCDQVPKPLEVSPNTGNGRYWLPEDRLDLDHLIHHQHPCPLANCRIQKTEHHLAWDHSEHHQRQGVLTASCGEGTACNNRPYRRMSPHDMAKLPQHHGADTLTPGSPRQESSFWHLHGFDHSSSYTENNAPDKRPRAPVPFKDSGNLCGAADLDGEDEEEMKEFMKIIKYTFARTPTTHKQEEDDEITIEPEASCDPAGNDSMAFFPMSM